MSEHLELSPMRRGRSALWGSAVVALVLACAPALPAAAAVTDPDPGSVTIDVEILPEPTPTLLNPEGELPATGIGDLGVTVGVGVALTAVGAVTFASWRSRRAQ